MRKLLLLFILLVFVSPVLALNQNFSLDNSLTGWGIVSGTWDHSGGYLVPSSSGGEINHTIGSNQNYIEIEFKPVGAYDNSFYWSGTNRGFHITSTNNVQPVGFTMTAFSLSTANYTTIKINIANSQINITAFYEDGKPIPGASQITTYNGTSDLFTFIDSSATGSIYLRRIFTSGVSPSASNSITWDAETYLKGGAQTFTWVLSDSIWNSIWTKKVRLYKEDVAYEAWTSCLLGVCSDLSYMILSAQTGSAPLHLTDGNYRIDLIEGLLSETVLDTASMRVLATAPSQMVMNTSIPSRVPFTIWNSVGYSFVPGQMFINVEHKINGNWILEQRVQVTTDPENTQVTVSGVGEYRFTLYDITYAVNLITRMATANAVDMPIQVNISTSVLTLERSPATYYAQDVMRGYFAIDNNNWTHGNTPYLAVRSTNDTIISAVFKEALSAQQQLNFALILGDGFELPTNRFRAGNNTLELRAFNTSSDRLLASVYFTLSDTDAEGNRLSTSKHDYCPSEQVIIFAAMPLQGNLTISNYKDLSKTVFTTKINGTDKAIIWKTSIPGDYLIRLLDGADNQIRGADIVVSSSCAEATPTTTPTTGTQATTDITNLLSSNIFWALLIVFGMMAATGITLAQAKITNAEIPIGMVGLLGVAAFSVIGWIPWWLTFSIIILVFVTFAWQQSKTVKTGG